MGCCLSASNSHNVSNVDTSGSLNNNSAFNGNNGARPDSTATPT